MVVDDIGGGALAFVTCDVCGFLLTVVLSNCVEASEETVEIGSVPFKVVPCSKTVVFRVGSGLSVMFSAIVLKMVAIRMAGHSSEDFIVPLGNRIKRRLSQCLHSIDIITKNHL